MEPTVRLRQAKPPKSTARTQNLSELDIDTWHLPRDKVRVIITPCNLNNKSFTLCRTTLRNLADFYSKTHSKPKFRKFVQKTHTKKRSPELRKAQRILHIPSTRQVPEKQKSELHITYVTVTKTTSRLWKHLEHAASGTSQKKKIPPLTRQLSHRTRLRGLWGEQRGHTKHSHAYTALTLYHKCWESSRSK